MGKFWEIIVLILVFAVAVYVGYLVAVAEPKAWVEGCDASFGKDNWSIKVVTGEGEYRFYMGQAWRCVANNITEVG